MSTTPNPYRLGRNVVPSAYRIFLTPDLEAATFSGRVEIDAAIASATREVTLHAIELALDPATITVGGTAHRSTDLSYDETYQTVTFTFDDELPAGDSVIEIAFTGILNDQLHGFYRSTYVDEAGQTRTIATTQFEHSDARRAFPCFDEPSFKATYQVNLTVPSHLAAYSNSPVASETDLGNGQKSISYTPTMKMSTYLVAFCVGPFEESRTVNVDGVPLRVLYPIGKGHLVDFALEAGEFALRFFSNYFNIPYPGDKLDMIAIPDFAFGAMENLGLVTYRETALLVDPENSSLGEKSRVAEVVAHEIAHMWFGDLVTMEWWEGIWLNEAFATFMAAMCTNAFRTEWKVWTSFGIDRDMALQVDGLHSTRPIEYEVISPDDTRGMFDVLTYEKGGSVLRMLEIWLGEETFRDGIRRYLKKHSYANTITTDLWDALEAESGQPVRDVANTWILQGGHPVVTFENGAISQKPFAYGKPRGESNIGSHWLVPVLTRSLQGGDVTRHLLKDTPIPVTDASPVVVNAGGSGCFRTRYGSAELAALSSHLRELDDLELATLVADAYASLFASLISWRDFKTVALGLGLKDDPTTWTIVAQATAMVSRALTPEQRVAFAADVREIFTPQFERLGWDVKKGESPLAGQLRAVVIGALGTWGQHEEIRREAAVRFDDNRAEGDLAAAILRIVADLGRPGDYEEFLRRYDNAPSPQVEQRMYMALAEFSDEKIALDAAEKAFSKFRNQDGPIILMLLQRNPTTGPAVWRYMTSRWDDALKAFPVNLQVRLAMAMSAFINDRAFAAEVEAFHAAHPVPGEQRMVNQAIERMFIGLDFAEKTRAEF
jgi:puromycin-sensitive aminopeptidase